MSITNEIAKVKDNDPTNLIQRRSEDFFTVLPAQWNTNGNTWLRLAQSAVNKNDNLRKAAAANPASLMRSLMECARLGHEPGTDRFYLVPKGNAVEGWESYKGIIQRILNSGRYQKVVAEVVYEGEKFSFNPNTDDVPTHEIDWIARNGGIKPVMSYAYAVHHDGKPTQVGVADAGYIKKVRSMGGPVWNKWETEMYLKSAVNRLEKFVATSNEDRAAYMQPPTLVEVGEPTIESQSAEAAEAEGEIFDGEIVADLSGSEVIEEYPAEDAGTEDAETVEL